MRLVILRSEETKNLGFDALQGRKNHRYKYVTTATGVQAVESLFINI